jgi:formate hydrogenlyase subunit 3/multisubunit Na+/H+ antiporter MnhD subunit
MKNLKADKKGIALIEIILIIAILLIIGSLFVRIFYAHAFHEWEDGIYRAIGLEPEVARLFVGIIAIIIFVIIAIKRSRTRKRKNIID